MTEFRKLSDWHRAKSHHSIGDSITVTVVQIESHCIFCRLPRAKVIRGYLPVDELSWELAEQTTKPFRYGSPIEVEVVGHDDFHRSILLSKKKADASPAGTFYPGKVMTARITVAEPWGFKVRLTGGVIGRLEWDETPNDLALPEICRLQPNDPIQVKILGHEEKTGQPLLSMLAPIQEDQEHITKLITEQRHDSRPETLAPFAVELPTKSSLKALHILVADNEESVRNAIRDHLTDRGHRVTVVGSLDELEKTLPKLKDFDAGLLDVQFDEENLTRTNLPKKLMNLNGNARLYLFTGNLDILKDEDCETLDHFLGVIHKLTRARQIINILEGRTHPEEISPESIGTAPEQEEEDREISSDHSIIERYLRREVKSISTAWEDSTVLVLRFDPEAKAIHLVASRHPGSSSLNLKKVDGLHLTELEGLLLDQSDCTLEREVFYEPQLKKLFLDMEAGFLIGTALHIAGYEDHLAVIHLGAIKPPPRVIQTVRLQLAHLTLRIERQLLQNRREIFQQQTQTGALLLGMTHEFHNMLNPINSCGDRLTGTLPPLTDGKAYPYSLQQNLAKTIFELASHNQRLTQVFRGLLEMTKRKSTQDEPLDLMLDDTIELCSKAARQYDISVVVIGRDSVPNLMVNTTFRQVLMNLMINAYQHLFIAESNVFGPGVRNGEKETLLQRRLIEVSMTVVPQDQFSIRIADNGYGISTRVRPRLFRLFESTREDGFGIGLYLSRKITESLGGTLICRQGVRYLRNTFEITLPTFPVKHN